MSVKVSRPPPHATVLDLAEGKRREPRVNERTTLPFLNVCHPPRNSSFDPPPLALPRLLSRKGGKRFFLSLSFQERLYTPAVRPVVTPSAMDHLFSPPSLSFPFSRGTAVRTLTQNFLPLGAGDSLPLQPFLWSRQSPAVSPPPPKRHPSSCCQVTPGSLDGGVEEQW